MSLASVSIVGNLVRAPELMSFASGRVKTTMVVAINNHRKNKDRALADFYKVEAWGKLAELANKYLAKGYQVTVSGRLVMDHWTDRHGNNRMTPIVEATQLAFPPKFRVVEENKTEPTQEEAEIVNPIGGELVMSDEDEEIEEEDDDDDDDDYEGSYGGPDAQGYKAAPQRGSPGSKRSSVKSSRNRAKLA